MLAEAQRFGSLILILIHKLKLGNKLLYLFLPALGLGEANEVSVAGKSLLDDVRYYIL